MRLSRFTLNLIAALLLALAISCGRGAGVIAPADAPNYTRGSVTRAELLAQLDGIAHADGTDPGVLDELKAALRAEIESGPERYAAKAPVGPRNVIADLVFATSEGGAEEIRWSYRNTGDYDLNGEVNAADISPIAGNFMGTPSDEGWDSAGQFADGDRNGEVNGADISPIAANLLSQVASYRVEGGADNSGPWTELGVLSFADGPKVLGNMRSYSFTVEGLGHAYYRVVPLDFSGAAGEPSAVAAEVVLRDNAVTVGPEYGLEFVSFDGETLVLTDIAGDTPVPVGSVVAGTENGGYLVHVETLERNGNTLTIGTSAASLADYILAGQLQATITPEEEEGGGGASSLRSASAFNYSHTFQAVSMDGKVLLDSGGLVVKVVRGSVQFKPTIHADAAFDTWLRMYYLNAYAEGEVSWDMELEITGNLAGKFSNQIELGRLDLPVPVPLAPGVVANCYLDFAAGVNGDGEFFGRSGFGNKRTYVAKVGVQYANGAWQNTSSSGNPVSIDKPFYIDNALSGRVTGYVQGVLGLSVNGVLGAGLQVQTSLEAQIAAYGQPNRFEWSLTGKADLGYEAWAKVWDWKLFDTSNNLVGAQFALGTGTIFEGGGGEGSTGAWRQSGADQFNRSYVDYVGPTGQASSWTAFGSFSGGVTGNSPTVGPDGTVYIGGEGGYLYAFNPDGSEKWKYDNGVNAKIYSAPAVTEGGTVYFGSIAPDGLFAIQDNGGSASLKWSFTEGNPAVQGSPTIDVDGTVYFGTTDPFSTGGQMKVFALTDNGASYTKKWEYNVAGPIYGAPAVWNNGDQARVYVGLADPGNGVTAITWDGGTAFSDWTYDAQDAVIGSPVIDKDDFPHNIVFGSLAGKVFSCNYTGDDVFGEPFVTQAEVRATPAVDPVDGTIYVADVANVLYSLTPDGAQRWTFVAGGPIYGGIALDSERRVFFAASNVLYGVRDFSDHGELELDYILDGFANAAPALEIYNGKPRAYVVGGSKLHCVFKP